MVSRIAMQRMTALTRILDTHAAWERRTLADLHVAGFKFRSVDQAVRYRKAQETVARMTTDDLVEIVLRGKAS